MTNNGGILLAGGTGSRLYPKTVVSNKHLLPVYDKPMIYYSLSIFLLSGIKNVTIVCNTHDLDSFQNLLGDGTELGIELSYSLQDKPLGIPDAINTAQVEKNYERFMVVLGDNFLYGRDVFQLIKNSIISNKNTAFYQKVKNPENFGVIKWDGQEVIDIIEKPSEYISNDAIIGIYIFDSEFSTHFKNIKKSSRGEYEITDIVKEYNIEFFEFQHIGRGTAWFDMGTNDDFFNCELFVKTIQDMQGLLVCSPHEISLQNNWITKEYLEECLKNYKNSDYFESLKKYAL